MKRLNKVLFGTTIALGVVTLEMNAQSVAGGAVNVDCTQVKKEGKLVKVDLDLVLDRLRLAQNKGLVLTPMIVGETDTLKMPAVEILGRKRYLYYLRNDKPASPETGTVERRHNGEPQTVHYSHATAYEKWMNNANLIIAEDACGCNQTLLGENVLNDVTDVTLGRPATWAYAYIQPTPEPIKRRDVEGSARLSFVVSKHDIRPDFGNNAAELAKIRATIDVVRNDKDVTLTGINLHGYASPDGNYSFNETLAANRTNALRNYLTNYYNQLDEKLFTATSTAEDWEGTRAAVISSALPDKNAVLALIDSNREPDNKDWAIRTEHPEAYRVLLSDIYPPLRRTDYKVTYNVRNFDLKEAQRIIRENPQKLSLNEMYSVANSYEKGSDDFNAVFDVAVRMFPDDRLANLNAANVALSRGDLTNAERFLKKAGDSPEAINARGVLAARQEQYTEARRLFNQARQAGLAEAEQNLKALDEQGD